MGHKMICGVLALGFSAAMFLSNQAAGQVQDRVSGTEKGSLFILSKVEIRWDLQDNVRQDTFVQLTNDFPGDVLVQMYFVNGDPPLAADPITGERAHPGWNWVDNEITLTANQPTYWSALTGRPGTDPPIPGPGGGGLSPWQVLDPGTPPGRPDPEVPGERMLRGFIVGWAVDADGEEIRWNHLAADATLLDYEDGWAYGYNGWQFAAVANVANGAKLGTPGVLNMDGVEYSRAFDQLLLNFQAVGSTAYSGPRSVISVTDVTLHPVSADLRQETDGPVTTKAHYDVWNQNETKLSGAYRCITCWDQTLLSNYGIPNHFLIQTLQTNHGKARIDGQMSQMCDTADVTSEPAAILGLSFKLLRIDGGADWAASGTNMFGMGFEDAVIEYDVLGPPPESNTGISSAKSGKMRSQLRR